jgi:hypothetical protein
MAQDPEVAEAVKLLLAASSNSKALNEAGVQRKSVDIDASNVAVGVPVLTQGSFSAQPLQEALGFQTKQVKQTEEVAAAVATLNIAADAVAQAQSAVETVATEVAPEAVEAIPPVEAVATETVTDEVKADDEQNAPDPAQETDKPSGLTDDDLKQIAAFVQQEVKAAMDQMKAEMDNVTKSLTQGIANAMNEAKADNLVKSYNAVPSMSIQERLHAFSAGRSDTTVIKSDDKLYAEQGKSMDTDPNIDNSAKFRQALGFQ